MPPADRDAAPPGTGGERVLLPEVTELLHCLGYIYLRNGQHNRALALLLLACRHDPQPRLLAALALALIETDRGCPALDVLDRLDGAPGELAGNPLLGVLRARALMAAGRVDEARDVFALSRAA
ncbi:MAG TPA: hypothetical protein VF286_11065 [Acidiphilium sp.]